MTHRFLLLAGSVILAPLTFSSAAHAQATCSDHGGTDAPAGQQNGNTACGGGADADRGNLNTAIGFESNAQNGATNNAINNDINVPWEISNGGNTAVGTVADAHGNQSFNVSLGAGPGDFSHSNNNFGPNSSGNDSVNIAVGARSNASGDGSANIAFGSSASATGSGRSSIAIGDSALSGGNNAISLGYNAHATADFSVAIGPGAVADQANTVSFGSGATNRRLVHVAAGTVSADSTDAVNGSQIYALSTSAQQALDTANAAQATAVQAQQGVVTVHNEALAAQGTANTALDNAATAQDTANTALDHADAAQTTADGAVLDAAAAQGTANTALAKAATAQGTADMALDNAATAQGTANTALGNAATAQGTADTALTTANVAVANGNALGTSTAAALGGGAAYNPATGALSAPAYAIGGTTYNNVGAAFGAVDSRLNQLSGRIDGVLNLAYDIRKEERRGIAAAVAIASAPMPSEPGKVSLAFNTAIFHGEVAYGGSVAARFDVKVPLAVTAGFGYAPGGNSTARVGFAGEF